MNVIDSGRRFSRQARLMKKLRSAPFLIRKVDNREKEFIAIPLILGEQIEDRISMDPGYALFVAPAITYRTHLNPALEP